ncbi:uncharacterized protein LOC143522424 [Brachyhypopomus gauderio]|uniref:uncharacterized protein LOC143522424 n=1 Tax=Brachyhypopomus gauderio TaxID=698409 RepID=UPI0040424A4B
MLSSLCLLIILVHLCESCTVVKSSQAVHIRAHVGESVLLPCSCTNTHTRPERFTWEKYNTHTNTWDEISSESEQYRNRVQLGTAHSPGNLSLLISHLTKEDGGVYRCDLGGQEHTDRILTVEGSSDTFNKYFLIAIPVLLLFLGLGIIFWTFKVQRRGQTATSVGQTGQWRDQQTQDDVMYCTIDSSNTARTVPEMETGNKTYYATINSN